MKIIKIIAIFLFTSAVSAETTLPETTETTQSQVIATTQEVPPVTTDNVASNPINNPQHAVLTQRVQERWTALIKHDFDAAYEFNSPTYREAFSSKAFKRNFATGKITWQRIEVVNIDLKDNDTATVTIKLHSIIHHLESGRDIPVASNSNESWIKVNDQWWYVNTTYN